MILKPRPETFPRVRKNIKFFQFASVVTGVMLFGLYIVAGIRWGLHSDIWLLTERGFATLIEVPPEGIEIDFSPEQGFNFTVVFLIFHGWFYVVYLIAAFSLWSSMRWPFWRFIAMAIAGCIVIVSFIVEVWMLRDARNTLAEEEAKHQAAGGQSKTPAAGAKPAES